MQKTLIKKNKADRFPNFKINWDMYSFPYAKTNIFFNEINFKEILSISNNRSLKDIKNYIIFYFFKLPPTTYIYMFYKNSILIK